MATSVNPLTVIRNAYKKLSRDELVLFLKVRNLHTAGTDDELASRLANHDSHTYHFLNSTQTLPASPSIDPCPFKPRTTPDLPVEILVDIIDRVGDWELARALGIPSLLPRPSDWTRASCMDEAVLTGNVQLIHAMDPAQNPPTKLGAIAAVRFGYVNVLEYLLTQHRRLFTTLFAGNVIPIKASRHGRTSVLSWWKHGFEQHSDMIPPPSVDAVAEAIDGASRNGQVASLDWWFDVYGHPVDYTEAALEYASAKNQIAVLEWWKERSKAHGVPLKVGRVMDMASTAGHVEVLEWWATSQIEFKYDKHALHHASCHGRVEVLEWWLQSGLQLAYDQEVLWGATRYNRPEVLEWWDKSGLPIQYRMCDIEEALEDAIGGGEKARAWWRQKGIDFNANDKEWMKLQNLH
ncbi:hypothetical protein EV715DRAFT_245234 [Schizophyllum commune]